MMNKPLRWKVVLALAALGLAAHAGAASFYLFPVQEIEGASKEGQAARTLLDKRVMARLFDGPAGRQAQAALVRRFVGRLAAAYPESVIHPKQVSDVNIGSGHVFLDRPDLQCKSAPSYNVADTYAVVVGITRASQYEVRKGDNVEVLVPVTLSLQFVRPSLAKVAYTMSETVYSPFRFSRQEVDSGAAETTIRAGVLKNLEEQVDVLVDSARQAFNPKTTAIKLLDRDGKFVVADGGIEAGFVKGEQVEARDAAGKGSVFDVLYADSGYAVLRPVAGSVSVGDSLQFVFEGSADDSRKPRLLPVAGEGDANASAVADMFARDIGFKAPFQISPVDVHFAQTRTLITRAANCVTWQKIPSMSEASGERNDAPDFFLRFTPVTSSAVALSGSGDTKTAEKFHTLVTAQVVDKYGKVVHSELGDNDYTVERVGGNGLSLPQAREVSLKNATGKLARNFIANARFVSRELRVSRVDGQRIWVEGMGAAPSERLNFDVLHPLSAKVGGKPALLDLEVSGGSADPAVEGELVGLAYSAPNPALPKPARGDIVRLHGEAAPGVTRVIDCNEGPYIGQNNAVEVAYLAPLVRHVVYQSRKYASHIGDPAFYDSANALLRAGLFDLQLQAPAIGVCSQPGYVIREDALQCEGASCKATVAMGLMARFKTGAEVQKTVTSGLRTEFGGLPQADKAGFYGYKQLGNGLSMQPDLLKKLNN
jgi:hypothetical protein